MSGVRIPFHLVDVFTDHPLSGNQLCVVPDPVDLATETMQAVAREIGFSETTFVTEAGGDRYAMRIFTPGSELPFAGHPTLGTAFVLVSEGRVTSPASQRLAAGEFAVEVDVASGFARMEQLTPAFGPDEGERREVAPALGLAVGDLDPDLPLQVVSTGVPYLVVPMTDLGALTRAAPHQRDLPAVLETLDAVGCYLFALPDPDGPESGPRARMFAPDIGVTEDAATGSAAGPLGAYLAENGLIEPGRVAITQGVEMGRPSTLLVDVDRAEGGDRWAIHVGGGVVKVGRGTFDLPG